MIDANTDLREEYEGQRFSHATITRRILDTLPPQSIVQLGIRAGTREEFALAGRLKHSGPRIDLPGPVWAWLEQRPTYLSVDIDAVDPADAPGTGNPEPAGVPARDLLTFVRRWGLLHIVGLDLVEVSPPYDPSGRTTVLAATIVREAILAIAGMA
jgi:agmatinase